MGEPTASKSRLWRGLNAALTLVLISTPLFLVQFFGSVTTRENSLSVSIRASSQADYGPDSQTFTVPPINVSILYQIIADSPATTSAQDRIAALQAELASPVPTMMDNTPPPTPTPTPLPQAVTGTVLTPSVLASSTPIATATPRVTPTPNPASTTIPDLSLPLPTIIALPSSLPTVLPLPTIPPLLPTVTSLLPTLPPLFP